MKAREGDDRGWDGWMASPTPWTWVWASSGRWERTGKPGVLQSTGSQKVGHDWATEQHRVQKLTTLKVPHEFIVYVWFFLLILNTSRISESRLFSLLIFCFKTPSVPSPELLQISPTWLLCFYPWLSVGSFSKQHPEWSLANRSQLFPFLHSNPSMISHLTER